jgi:predicted Zn-dependent protease
VLARHYPRGQEPEELVLLQCSLLTSLNRVVDSVSRLEALAQRPNASADAWYQYGETLMNSGDAVNARLVMQNAATRFPQDQRLSHSLAKIQSQSLPITMSR